MTGALVPDTGASATSEEPSGSFGARFTGVDWAKVEP